MDNLSLAGGAGGIVLVLIALVYRSGLMAKLLPLLSKKQPAATEASPAKGDTVRPESELQAFLARHQKDQERLDAERTLIHEFLNFDPPTAGGVPLGVFPKPEKSND